MTNYWFFSNLATFSTQDRWWGKQKVVRKERMFSCGGLGSVSGSVTHFQANILWWVSMSVSYNAFKLPLALPIPGLLWGLQKALIYFRQPQGLQHLQSSPESLQHCVIQLYTSHGPPIPSPFHSTPLCWGFFHRDPSRPALWLVFHSLCTGGILPWLDITFLETLYATPLKVLSWEYQHLSDIGWDCQIYPPCMYIF